MSEIERWREDFREAKELLNNRFPDLRCVRCQTEKFAMRVWRDASLDPAYNDTRVMELVCENCGFVEKHVVERLTAKERAG